MQADGAVRRGDANPRRGRPNAVLVVTIAASPIVHDDAWNVPNNTSLAVIHDDVDNLHASTWSAHQVRKPADVPCGGGRDPTGRRRAVGEEGGI